MFSLLHFFLIGLTIIVPLAMIAATRLAAKERRATFDWAQRIGLALLLAISEPVYQILHLVAGTYAWDNAVPMHLCDWALVATAIALWKQWRLAYDLAYFWGLSGTLQAILTPDISFPSAATTAYDNASFVLFFVQHCGIVAGVLYLTFGTDLRPTWRSYGHGFLGTSIFYVCAIATNSLLGTNFGYLAHRPPGGSLLDILSETWGLYIIEIYILGAIFLTFLYLPWVVYDALRPRVPSDSQAPEQDASLR